MNATEEKRPRTMGDGPFGWYTKAAHDRAIEAAGGIGGAIYIGLTKRQSDAGSKGKVEFYASIQNIAAACSFSVRTVAKHIPLLERAGLVRHISGRHAGEDGAHCANRWVLIAFPTPGYKDRLLVAHKDSAVAPKLRRPRSVSNANRERISRSTDRERSSTTPAATAVPVGPACRVVETPARLTPQQQIAVETERRARLKQYQDEAGIIASLKP